MLYLKGENAAYMRPRVCKRSPPLLPPNPRSRMWQSLVTQPPGSVTHRGFPPGGGVRPACTRRCWANSMLLLSLTQIALGSSSVCFRALQDFQYFSLFFTE